MLSSSSPASSASVSQRSKSARSCSWWRSEPRASVFETNVPRPWRATTSDGVRVDREVGDDFAHRRQLVSHLDRPEPERLLDLLDDLQVRRNTGPWVEMELDHSPIVTPL